MKRIRTTIDIGPVQFALLGEFSSNDDLHIKASSYNDVFPLLNEETQKLIEKKLRGEGK